ncbi:MAG: HNH endonuclease [Lewinellaceae bacterium]|nr:HNH endonuclease [Lewinellaceae bacterium]
MKQKTFSPEENKTLEVKYKNLLDDIPRMVGEERLSLIKTRVNQSVFRQFVLANYNYSCAISGINATDLLVASHIIPWSVNVEERLNPENGLCLSAIHDRAFDKGLISIDTDFKIRISKELKQFSKEPFFNSHFGQFENKPLKRAWEIPSSKRLYRISPQYYLPKIRLTLAKQIQFSEWWHISLPFVLIFQQKLKTKGKTMCHH